MPIYAYRCEACGFAKDVLQKVSDPQLTVCLSCGEPSFKKQVTAAGFQLKGTGWYATDFRNGTSTAAPPAAGGNDEGKDSGDAKPAADKPATADAAATTAAPAAKPAGSAPSGNTSSNTPPNTSSNAPGKTPAVSTGSSGSPNV